MPRHTLPFRVLLGLSVIFVPFATTTAADKSESNAFRFIQICDTQLGFGEKGYDQDVETFRQAVRQINAMKPAFVLICGDLVNKPELQAFADFKNVMAELSHQFVELGK